MTSLQRLATVHAAFKRALEPEGIPVEKVTTLISDCGSPFAPRHITIRHGIQWGKSDKPEYLVWDLPYVKSNAGTKLLNRLHKDLNDIPEVTAVRTGQVESEVGLRPYAASPNAIGHDNQKSVHTLIATHKIPYGELTDYEKRLFREFEKGEINPWWENPAGIKLQNSLHRRFMNPKPTR